MLLKGGAADGHHGAAIGEKSRAGDKSGVVGGQESNDSGDVFGGAQAAHGVYVRAGFQGAFRVAG